MKEGTAYGRTFLSRCQADLVMYNKYNERLFGMQHFCHGQT